MSPDVKALEEELRRDPNSRRFSDLAREYQRIGKLEEALALCEKGLQRHPSQSQGRLIQAQIYLGQGRLNDAKGAVEKILLALPDHVAANHMAGDIFSAQGDLDRALRHYRVVDLFDPGRKDIAARVAEISKRLTNIATEDTEAKAAGTSIQAEEPPIAQAGPLPDADAVTQEVEAVTEEVHSAPAVRPPPQPAPVQEPFQEQRRQTEDSATDAESLSGTIRMPQVRSEIADAIAVPSVEAATPQPEVDGPPCPSEAFSDLLPGIEDDFLGSDLLDVHEQTLLSLPKAPPAAQPVLEDVAAASSLPRPAVPMPAVQRADARESVGDAEDEVPLAAAPSLNTTTLAELYAHQGFPEKAVEIYQRVLLQDPDQPEIKKKIQDLKLRMSGEAPELPEIQQEDVRRALRQRRVQVLESWLRRVKEEQHV